MASRRITDAEVLSYELRGNPLRHHVYTVRLRWSTGLVTVIYRRYSQFFDFQCRLLDAFPKEAGLYDHRERVIPFIPGKVLFGQSLKKKTVEYRRHAFNTYCQRLVRLPAHMSQCRLVHEFFETRDSDLKHLTDGASNGAGQKKASSNAQISAPLRVEQYVVVASYVRQSSGECSVTAGSLVEVIDKKETGWWFVQSDDAEQGWVPATYLEPIYEAVDATDGGHSPPEADEPQSYVCSNDYSASSSDELSLQRGVLVEVLTKRMTGWWTIRCDGKVGLGPAANLVKADSRKAKSVREAIASPGTWPQPVSASQRRRGPPPRVSDTRPAELQETAGTSRPLPRRPHPPSKRTTGKLYQAIGNYSAGSTDDSMSLSLGQVVEVVERSPTGWWYVCGEGCVGWAPSTYLVEATASTAVAASTPPMMHHSEADATASGAARLSDDEETTSGGNRAASTTFPVPTAQQPSELASRLLDRAAAAATPSGDREASPTLQTSSEVSAGAAVTMPPPRPQPPQRTGCPPQQHRQQPATELSSRADSAAAAAGGAADLLRLARQTSARARSEPLPRPTPRTALAPTNHQPSGHGREVGTGQVQPQEPSPAARRPSVAGSRVSLLVQQLEGGLKKA